MSTWMASDDDFFVIRRFSQLSARVVLFMQNRIAGLEKIVQEENAKCLEAKGMRESENGSFDLDCSTRRQKAMDELVWRLEHYCESTVDSHYSSLLLTALDREIRAGPFGAQGKT